MNKIIGDSDEALKTEIDNANNLLGKKNIKGEGVIIIVDDSEIQTSDIDDVALENLNLQLSDLIVHDTVLLAIVNELYIRRSRSSKH